MSVVRKSVFKAKKDKADAVKEFLGPLVPALRQVAGNEGATLLQSREDPTEFVMIEFWESAEAHAASAKNIPPDLIMKGILLLAGMPTGAYYDVVGGGEKEGLSDED